MATGLLTPLQISVAAALLSNQGLQPLPAALTSAISAFNATAVIANFLAAVNYYVAQSWATSSTLLALQSIGNSICPALGNSIPIAYTNLTPVTNPAGFSGLITQTGNAYLGNGSGSKFTQGFLAVQGYINSINQLVNSSTNAQTYLGPTFRGMDALTTNNISSMNRDLRGFGVDLGRQGKLVNFADIKNYGTPVGLLRQISKLAGIRRGTLNIVEVPLMAAGLTSDNIKTLIDGNREDDPLTFDKYQQLAYQGMSNITGSDLQQILDILDVTTPNIQNLADLLDQKKIFPNSWCSMSTPTSTGYTPTYLPNGDVDTSNGGYVPIYLPDGSVDMNLAGDVSVYLPTASGCEELGKIIPPEQAVANKAVQSAYQQLTGITNSTLPELAETVLGQTPNTWTPNRTYLGDSVVSDGANMPTFYRAQQNVPVGVDITDTNYWLPTSLGGISTMAGLPDIQAQTTAITQTTADFYKNNIATGTGLNGTITTCDVIGLAIDHNNVAAQLNIATDAINTLNSAGALNTLKSTYLSMTSAANDAAMLALISTANSNIASIAASQSTLVATLNTAFNVIASSLSKEKGYQIGAGIDYLSFPEGLQTSIVSFVQNLPQYAELTQACGAAQFLNEVADTSTAGGQNIVGAMREARNSRRLNAAQLGVDTKPSSEPPITPVPVVTPVDSWTGSSCRPAN